MKRLSEVFAALFFAFASIFLPLSSNVSAAQVVSKVAYSAQEGEVADVWINNTMANPQDAQPGSKAWTNDGVSYEWNDGDLVTFKFETLYIDVINYLKINDTVLTNQLPSTKEDLAAHYANQHISFTVQVPKADTYNVITKSANITQEQQFFGNFLWENDETEVHAFPDDIIGQGTISFVKAVTNGVTYNSVDDLNNNCGLNYCHWANSIVTEEDPDGSTGGAEFPVGTVLTVKLIPNAGYQLTSFGINGGQFTPQANVGEYTFTIRGGNAHLAAKFESVANAVNANATSAISSGSIVLNNEPSMGMGTARLDIVDKELPSDKVDNFKNATPAGYDISNFVDISLFNTVYKASAAASWDTQVNELEHKATVTLKLDDGVDGSNFVIIHEKHDGTYEVIETTYDPETNTISFEVDSFSNYAIASKPVAGTPNSGVNTTVATASVVSSGAAALFAVTVLSTALWFASEKIRK